ncbi:MAG: hypothetical protein ACREV1_05885 [Gammaproteobacteria bacterium]
MQLRFKTRLTSEEYVSRQAWRDASLPHCPLHPRGGCSLARHGTYERVNPPGTRVSRWYCPHGHRTFSLLPDCLAARFPGSLCAIEQVVAQVSRGVQKSPLMGIENSPPSLDNRRVEDDTCRE